MCDAHKSTCSQIWEEINYDNAVQVIEEKKGTEEKKVIVKIPEWSTDEQVQTFAEKVFNIFKETFKL